MDLLEEDLKAKKLLDRLDINCLFLLRLLETALKPALVIFDPPEGDVRIRKLAGAQLYNILLDRIL